MTTVVGPQSAPNTGMLSRVLSLGREFLIGFTQPTKYNYHMGWPTPYIINGWKDDEIKRQKDAVELETVVNESIQSLLKYMRYLEPAE
jgi:hypothetical protein